MRKSDFAQFARHLLGHEVQVVTTAGPYTGKLKVVGDDMLGLHSYMNGNKVKIAIRIKEVVAIFKVDHGGRGRPGWGAMESSGLKESSNQKESSSFKY